MASLDRQPISQIAQGLGALRCVVVVVVVVALRCIALHCIAERCLGLINYLSPAVSDA